MLLFGSLTSIGQTMRLAVNIDNNYTAAWTVKLIGRDSVVYSIKGIDTVMFDFSKSTNYRAEFRMDSMTIVVDSIRSDIKRLRIRTDNYSPKSCIYFVDRKKGNRNSQVTDCFGTNCKHKIVAFTENGFISVHWYGLPRAYLITGQKGKVIEMDRKTYRREKRRLKRQSK